MNTCFTMSMFSKLSVFCLLTFMAGVGIFKLTLVLVCWLCMQWVPQRSLLPQRSSTSLLTHATYSCDSQLVFAGFHDGCVGIFDAKNLEPCCWLAPSIYIPQGVHRYVPMLDQYIDKCMASILTSKNLPRWYQTL